MEVWLERHQRRRLPPQQPREIGGVVHRLALRQVDQDRRHVRSRPAQIDAAQDVGLVLPRRQPCRLLVAGNLRQSIDRRTRRLFRTDAVAVDRDEQVGMEPPRDAEAFAQHQIAVVVAGQRHPHPAAVQKLVADRARDLQRHVLFAQPGLGVDRAGVDPAMARVDHHQRAAAVALHARQRRRLGGWRHRLHHLVAGAAAGQVEGEGEEVERPRQARLPRRHPIGGGERQRQPATVAREAAVGDHGRRGEVEYQPGAAVRGRAGMDHRKVAAYLRDVAGHARQVHRQPLRTRGDAAGGARHRRVEADDDAARARGDIDDRSPQHRRRRQPAQHGQDQRQHHTLMPYPASAGPAGMFRVVSRVIDHCGNAAYARHPCGLVNQCKYSRIGGVFVRYRCKSAPVAVSRSRCYLWIAPVRRVSFDAAPGVAVAPAFRGAAFQVDARMTHNPHPQHRPAPAGGIAVVRQPRDLSRRAPRAEALRHPRAAGARRAAASHRRAPPRTAWRAWRLFNDHTHADRRTPPGRDPRGGRPG